MTDIDMNALRFVEIETDPEILDKGETALHGALHILQYQFDPAYTFVLYRFNRIGIKHPTLDAIITMDTDNNPTLGINYEKFIEMSLLAQVSLLEHHVGHLMSGHLGNRLGTELREYCEKKFGTFFGRKLYSLIIESIADSYVTYPGALKDAGRPHYDVRRLGMDRWSYTLNVLQKLEDLIEKQGGGSQDGQNKILQQIVGAMSDDESEWDEDCQPLSFDVDGESDVGNGKEIPGAGGGLDGETGGLPVKDIIHIDSREDGLIAEDKVREICKEAIRSTEHKSRGYLSGDASQFIEADEKPPIVPWHQRLNHMITSGISTERRVTKRRLNRRNPDFGFGRVLMNLTTVGFIIDTSGSMGKDELCRIDAELNAIAQITEQPIPVIHCDAGVAKCEEYRRGVKLEKFFGRGGTDFKPALHYVKKNFREVPDILVYFTDGYGGRLDDDNPIIEPWESTMLWILTPKGMGEEQFRARITELGEVIKVEDWDQ